MKAVEEVSDWMTIVEETKDLWNSVKSFLTELDTKEGYVYCLFNSLQLCISTDDPTVIGVILKHGGVFRRKEFSESTGLYMYLYKIGKLEIVVSNKDVLKCKITRVTVEEPARTYEKFIPSADCDPLLADERGAE
jgi:hypothetical protein